MIAALALVAILIFLLGLGWWALVAEVRIDRKSAAYLIEIVPSGMWTVSYRDALGEVTEIGYGHESDLALAEQNARLCVEREREDANRRKMWRESTIHIEVDL